MLDAPPFLSCPQGVGFSYPSCRSSVRFVDMRKYCSELGTSTRQETRLQSNIEWAVKNVRMGRIVNESLFGSVTVLYVQGTYVPAFTA